jgi:DNA-binding Lrp family transcriptional regulator
VRLAQGVGLSPSACLRRIKIMERAGVSRGYTAFVDTSNAEASIAVIINITLERQTEDHLDRFEASVRKYPEIRECFLMTGGSDYLLVWRSRMRASSNEVTGTFCQSSPAS